MNFIQKIILINILLLQSVIYNAYSADGDDQFDWMNENVITFSPPCIEVPAISGMNQSSTSLNVESQGVWVPTGVRVEEGKLLAMSWNLGGISLKPQKYRVLYRVDPRFSNPQIFIQKYDYSKNKYITDFNTYNSGSLLFYQQKPDIFSLERIQDYNNYFAFSGRQKIKVKKGDVINITLDSTGKFFGSEGDMQGGLISSLNKELAIVTDSSGLRNKIMYASAASWCKDIIVPSSVSDYPSRCLSIPNKYIINSADQTNLLIGQTSDSYFTSKIISIPSCPDNSDGANNDPVCFYDNGRGFNVNVGGLTIKNHKEKFIYSPFSNKYFLYHYSDSVGDLDFTSNWPINGMYDDFLQNMSDWNNFTIGTDDQTNYRSLVSYLQSKVTAPVNFFHFGVYTMEIEIGTAESISASDLNSVKLDYFISDSVTPNVNSVSNSASQDFKANAYDSGWLWLKVSADSELSGSLNVKIANYTGSTLFSSVVYNQLVSPLRDKYNELSRIIYEKLVSNTTLQNIAKSCLVLYIIIYGLAFLAGSIQITATDIVTRVIKVGVIGALFSETSWTFFNDNLFQMFISGSDYLLNSVIGITSNVGNIFGFVDPIFERYTDSNFWSLLFIQLLQLTNGLAFFACLAMYSIIIYLRAVIEVIISYCLAFLGLAVMISLAPFFIILMLFEQTKSMFDSWLSTLFSYMMQPTILLIFFLLIDQMMAEYIKDLVIRACWGILIPLKISLDLSNIGIPISFSFTLPFLPGIPFYIPEVTNISSIGDFFAAHGTFVRISTTGFIFFIYCKLSSGSVEYVTLVTQFLTNVLAARQEGELQRAANPVKDVMNDMGRLARPVTSTARGVGSFVKEKFIDQKITHNNKHQDNEEMGSGSNDDDKDSSKRSGLSGLESSKGSSQKSDNEEIENTNILSEKGKLSDSSRGNDNIQNRSNHENSPASSDQLPSSDEKNNQIERNEAVSSNSEDVDKSKTVDRSDKNITDKKDE